MSGVSLNQLSLKNFRCFSALDLADIDGSVAIVGQNGSGKTTILEAISLLSPGRGIRSAPAASIGNPDSDGRWKVSARLTTETDTPAWIDTFYGEGRSRSVAICDKPTLQVNLNEVVKILWISPLMDRIWVDGPEGRRRFLDRMAMSLFPDHPNLANGYLKSMRERNLLLRDHDSHGAWFDGLEERMAEFGSLLTRNRNRTLDCIRTSFVDEGEKLPRPLLELIYPDTKRPETDFSDKDSLVRLWQATRPQELHAGRTLNGPHKADLKVVHSTTGIPAQYCSTGEQKILLLTIVIAGARTLANTLGQPPILLFDELVAHLDQVYRQILLDEVRRMDLQVWMTGTEKDIFQPFCKDFEIIDIHALKSESP